MGVLKFDRELVERAIGKYDIKSVLQYGSQNWYETQEEKPPFFSEFYKQKGIEIVSVDLAGDDGALQVDLSYPVDLGRQFDLVTDHGQGEHIVQMEGYQTVAFHDGHIHSIYPTEVKDIDAGYYYGWLNKHTHLKVGGMMINVNPKSQHWPLHAFSYINQDFYTELVKLTDYEIIELGEEAALGNYENGVNIYCIMKKHLDKFPSLEEFKQLPIYKQ